MEQYLQYETGEPISRGQYIVNGLARGELLNKLDCGCVIIQDQTAGAYIVFCAKHEAALDLYEALKLIKDWCEADPNEVPDELVKLIADKSDRAIAKAEGKGS